MYHSCYEDAQSTINLDGAQHRSGTNKHYVEAKHSTRGSTVLHQQLPSIATAGYQELQLFPSHLVVGLDGMASGCALGGSGWICGKKFSLKELSGA